MPLREPEEIALSTLPDLPIPDFYRPESAADWSYGADQQRLMEKAVAWRSRFELPRASTDRVKVHLLLVDLQKDFCFPEGTLYVGGRTGRGAIEDNDRIARFIYRNLGRISEITCTLDTHFPYQIFSPAFWLDAQGEPPAAHREITVEDVRKGRVRPDPAMADWISGGDYDWLRRQVEYYCEKLEEQGRYTLYLWPPHCILGSDGHALAGVIHEARLFHAYARHSRAAIEVKGDLPLTEYYSVIGPEVLTRFDGLPLAEKNLDFIRILSESDAVLIAGQAASHCVRSTIEDLLHHLEEYSARKVYILRDCMSSVAVPDPERPGEFVFDFTPQAEAAIREFAAAGMHVVESATPMSEWPDFPTT
jgi:nicotinamidase-related amidase